MVQISRILSPAVLVYAWGLAAASGAAPLGSVVAVEASLAASNEVPPNSSMGTGLLDASFNRETNVLNYTITYSGLSGPVKAGHFHGPASAGTNAGVALPFVDGMDSPIKGTAILNAAQVADLLAGKWYVNLHTASNPGGEIRGQVHVK
jgi:CHRD domain